MNILHPLSQLVYSCQLFTKFRDLSNLIDMFKNADNYCSITTKSDVSEKLVKMFFKYKKSITGHGFNNSTFHSDTTHYVRPILDVIYSYKC